MLLATIQRSAPLMMLLIMPKHYNQTNETREPEMKAEIKMIVGVILLIASILYLSIEISTEIKEAGTVRGVIITE